VKGSYDGEPGRGVCGKPPRVVSGAPATDRPCLARLSVQAFVPRFGRNVLMAGSLTNTPGLVSHLWTAASYFGSAISSPQIHHRVSRTAAAAASSGSPRRHGISTTVTRNPILHGSCTIIGETCLDLAPPDGLEPSTVRLTVGSSAS
jgi:hypothetical protein